MIYKINSLIKELNAASDAYYNNADPIMTDAEWDAKFDELRQLESETGIIMSNSPTQNVGFEVKSELKKVTHTSPMMSLDKTKSVDDLRKFSKGRPCVLSLKMDGLTIRLTYEKGDLVLAETRGNGEIGEDVTHNVKQIKNIPLHINHNGKYIIEGECIITYDDFENINAKLPDDKKYKNPRNLASGSIRQLDSRIAKERNLKFVAWKVVEGDENNSYEERLKNAEKYGFTIVVWLGFAKNDPIEEDDITYLREAAKKRLYPIDGLVLTFDNIEYGKSLGMTGHHPRHSIAFKFFEEEADTRLLDIEWTMGKTGDLTPVAVFETVELAGTEVSRASLHNVSIMKQLYDGYWHVGMELVVKKSNEIIPYVVSASTTLDDAVERYLPIPGSCPICGGKTEIRQDNDSEVLCCTNSHCQGKLLGRLAHSCSREALDIRGLSEKTLEMLINKGYVNKLEDIFNLKASKYSLSNLPGMGAKSVDKLLKSIDKARNTTVQRLIIALNIPNVGKSTAKILANHVDDWQDFIEKANNGYHWSKLSDIGSETELSINSFISDHYEEIQNLTYCFDEISNNKQESGSKLEGKTFVVTGKLQHYSNRKELESVIVANGGKVAGSVSKNTSFLINNDIESNSGKNKKAKELGIHIITEADFIRQIN